MNSRIDISDYLIHFTKGETIHHAFENLKSIITDYKLIAGNGMIKGGFNCVCFTEAPLSSIKEGLLNDKYYSKYSPFGIMIEKKWLFEQGGRPVIYQPESEYKLLKENAWRHVTYNPIANPAVDFTWEREWRIHQNELEIGEHVSQVIVPNKEWAYALRDSFNWDLENEKRKLELIFDDPLLAEMYANDRAYDFMWDVITLK